MSWGAGAQNVPPYWVALTTKVPEAQGLPHFSDVRIWNTKATGAKTAFNVSAYPNATLDNFRLDHLHIEAAGTIANAKHRQYHQDCRWKQAGLHGFYGERLPRCTLRRAEVT